MSSSLNAENAERGAERAEKNLLGFWAAAHFGLFRLRYVLTLTPMRPCLFSPRPMMFRVATPRSVIRQGLRRAMTAGGGNDLKRLLLGGAFTLPRRD
jgi:hypothetical protein